MCQEGQQPQRKQYGLPGSKREAYPHHNGDVGILIRDVVHGPAIQLTVLGDCLALGGVGQTGKAA